MIMTFHHLEELEEGRQQILHRYVLRPGVLLIHLGRILLLLPPAIGEVEGGGIRSLNLPLETLLVEVAVITHSTREEGEEDHHHRCLKQ